MSSDDVTKPSLGNELSYSCCLNDKDQFVFSFFFDEDIYVVSLQDGEMKKIKVKSRYIDKPAIKENPPQDFDGAMKASSEIPCYGNLIYDVTKPSEDIIGGNLIGKGLSTFLTVSTTT